MNDAQALAVIAANIHRIRGKRSMAWLARETGTYPINISRIETGESMPGAGLLARIAEALKVTTDELVTPNQKKSSRTA